MLGKSRKSETDLQLGVTILLDKNERVSNPPKKSSEKVKGMKHDTKSKVHKKEPDKNLHSIESFGIFNK